MIKRLALLSALVAAFSVQAAPTITGLSGSAVNDQNITINGSGFGANAIRQTWFGGISGLVDSASNGTRIDTMNVAGLSLLPPSTATYPHVSTERGWSNGKSLTFDVRSTDEYKQTLFLDMGSYTNLYTNAVIYLTHDDLASGSYLQWKMMRWTRNPTVVDGDGSYLSNRINSSSFFSVFSSSGQRTVWLSPGLPGRGAWYRYETWLQMNSGPGTADGTFRVRVTNPTTGQAVIDSATSGIAFNGSGDSGAYRYFVLQNYFGNATDSGANQKANGNAAAWWDEIFVATSPARVEICSESTYNSCKNREIQAASSWSDGSVVVKLNRSHETSLDGKYLYVTSARGEVNAQGYPLAGGTSDPIPNPPTSVRAQ